MIASVRNVRLNLSKYLDLVRRGEEIVVKNRNTPVARIVPFKSGKGQSSFPDLSELRKRQKTLGGSSEELVRVDRDGRD